MRKLLVCSVMALSLVGLLLITGCGRQDSGGGGGDKNPTISVSQLFDVSGARAIAAASSSTASSSGVSVSAIKSYSANNVTELLKMNASGEITSALSTALAKRWHPPISVIETGPDGSLYVGFQWGIWVSSSEGREEKDAAFFKIKKDGSVEIVDDTIYGVGTWYGGSENGELPAKQVQFDSNGDLYYLAKNSSGNTTLKKKTTAGVISQIGSSNYEVRDFIVTPGGFVLFHGSNVGNWSIEWLKVIYGSTVSTIFYNDGAGWLRAYYYYNYSGTNYVFLIGENLTLLDQNAVPKKYSGIIRATLNSSGAPTAVAALYDDNNMYNDNYSTIGGQLTWGYWDPVEMTNKNFFARDNYNNVILPLTLEAGVTEEAVRAFIRQKYHSVTTDNLSNIAFSGLTTTESWQVNNYLDSIISSNITGETWAKWREENGLNSVRFGNAKQLVFAENGKLYAVMRLDDWGSGSSKGDKLFQVVNAYGSAEIAGFPQDTANYYKSMSKVRSYGDYAVYLSNKVGQYKIYRLNLTNATAAPVDMIPLKSNIEIFNYSYDSAANMLYYDVYDLSNNTSYLATQVLTSTTAASEVSAEGYTITDIVPFQSTK